MTLEDEENDMRTHSIISAGFPVWLVCKNIGEPRPPQNGYFLELVVAYHTHGEQGKRADYASAYPITICTEIPGDAPQLNETEVLAFFLTREEAERKKAELELEDKKVDTTEVKIC